MSEDLLAIEDLTVELPIEGGLHTILDGVRLAISRGEIRGLVGESGCGKSMTARSVLRMLPRGARCRGRVLLAGDDILELDPVGLRSVRQRRISMVFQDPRSSTNPVRSCGSQLAEVVRIATSCSRRAAMSRATELLGDVGIADPGRVMRAYPHQLSGGLLQRVTIAAALAPDPDLIIADEATTALDVTTQAEVVALFNQLRRSRDLSLLFITHDLELAGTLCDRIAVMYAGRIVEEQGSAALFAAPRHPYTAALLSSRPRIDRRVGELAVIRGRVPGPNEHVSGCAFHPRCDFATAECISTKPQLRELANGARVACLRAEEIALSRPASSAVVRRT